MKNHLVRTLFASLILAHSALAAEDVNQGFTLDGRLYGDAAATSPLLDLVQLKLQVLDAAQTCILYEETQNVDTTATNGYYSIVVGQKRSHIRRTSGDSNTALSTVYSNTVTSIPGKLVSNGAACTYTPTSGDARYLKVTMLPSDNISRTMGTNMVMNSVPMATVAERAESLQGFTAANFLKTTDAGTGANQVVKLDGTSKLPAVDGSLLTSLDPNNLSSAVSIAKGGTGQTAKASSFNALSPNSSKGDVLVHDGTNNVRLPVGTNNFVLTADSSAAHGVKWAASSGGITSETDPNVQAWAKAAPNANFDTTGSVLNLANTAVTAGSYGSASSIPTFTVDAKGRLTAAANVTVSDSAKLPLAGGTMSGPINLAGNDLTAAGHVALSANKNFQLGNFASDPSTTGWGAAEKGRTWFNTSGNSLKYWDGTTIQTLGAAGAGIASLNGASGTSQSFATPGTSGTAPAWTTNTTTNVHTLNIPMASATGVTAGLLNKTDYDAFSGKLGTSTSFVGDVSGTYGATSVDKIKGKAVAPTTYASGQTLRYDGTSWINAALGFADLSGKPTTLAGYGITDAQSSALAAGRIFVGNGSGVATAVALSGDATLSNAGAITLNTVPIGKGGTGLTSFASDKLVTTSGAGALQTSSCGLNQVVSFTAGGAITCANVSALSSSFVQDGNSFTAAATLGTNDAQALNFETTDTVRMTILATGNVGVGTASPSEKLEVNGNVKAVNLILTSDARLKKDVQPIDGLSAILRLRGVQYKWIRTGDGDAGVLAQEVEEVFPDAVQTDAKTGFKGVKYQYLFAPVIEAIKELYNQNKTQDDKMDQVQAQAAEEIRQLKTENARLMKRLDDIERKLNQQ